MYNVNYRAILESMRLRAPGMITRKVTQPITVKVRNITDRLGNYYMIISQFHNVAIFIIFQLI